MTVSIAYLASRAERSAHEQTQEAHVAEMKRQREHEQMVAQIHRTDRWLDDCIHPVGELLGSIMISRQIIIGDIVNLLISTQPSVVEEMMKFAGAMYPIHPDGTVRRRGNGEIIFDPSPEPTLSRGYNDGSECHASGAAVAIGALDWWQTHQLPFCRELPDAMLGAIAAESSGPVAQAYRHYCRTVLVGQLRKIVDILNEHSATITWPDKEWLASKWDNQFPWVAFSTSLFFQQMSAYTLSFESIIVDWEADDFTRTCPALGQAFCGLQACINWWVIVAPNLHLLLLGKMNVSFASQCHRRSRERGEVKQAELVRMSPRCGLHRMD